MRENDFVMTSHVSQPPADQIRLAVSRAPLCCPWAHAVSRVGACTPSFLLPGREPLTARACTAGRDAPPRLPRARAGRPAGGPLAAALPPRRGRVCGQARRGG